MTSASQFSLEEENFYKDIQDLVKKGSENEKELSTFLQRYMDLLARSDLDDETFIINFTKAALIIEASAKVYGSKVDRLWINLERVLEALKVNGKNEKKKSENEDDVEDVETEALLPDDADPQKKIPSTRKRRKLGDVLSSPDDFLEIDNISGLLGKNMNETVNNGDVKIKFHEEIPNLFIRNKTERKRIDVCLVRVTDDRDDSRLRDWIVSEENMLVKEIYSSQSEPASELSGLPTVGESHSDCGDDNFENNCFNGSEPLYSEPVFCDNENEVSQCENDPETNNNSENLPDAALQEKTLEQQMESEKFYSSENRDMVVDAMNKSQEVDLGKFPNIFLKRLEDCLVDVNEVFWNSTRFQDVIPSRKMRIKKTHRIPCKLCFDKKAHSRKGKRCHVSDKNECLDAFFSPLVQPTVSDLPIGMLMDEELYHAYKVEMKLIDQLGKVDGSKNFYEAYHPEDIHEDGGNNFLGFDGYETSLMRRHTDLEDCDVPEDNIEPDLDDDNADLPESDCELPLPQTDNNPRISGPAPSDVFPELSDSGLEQSGLSYQNIAHQELQNHESAMSKFERNKELGIKISKWHSSLTSKIELAQKRGALNMDLLAGKIMQSFPETQPGEKAVISFRDLVRNQCRKDVPRYFFACLQLTNEGNVDIVKESLQPLATDCMVIKKLRATRIRHELDEYTPNCSTPKGMEKSRSQSTSSSPPKRKRYSHSFSSSDSEYEEPVKKKASARSRSQSSQEQQRKRKLNAENKGKRKKKKPEEELEEELSMWEEENGGS